MNNYSNHKGKSDCTESEVRRFSSAYKQAMEPITVSPELRERILRLQDKKIQPRWIKIVRTTACAAACLTIVLAARGWLVTESQNLSISNESTASTAAYSGTDSSAIAGSPETGSADAGQQSGETSGDGSLSAQSESAEIEEAAQPEEAAAPSSQQADSATASEQTVSPKEKMPSSGTSEPAVESSHTDTDNSKVYSSSTTAGTAGEENDGSSQAAFNSVIPQETSGVTAPASDQPDTAGSVGSHTTAPVSGSGTAVVNPSSSCSSAEEAEAVLGWSIVSPDLTGASLSLIDGSLFQASWENGQCYRMARTSEWGADISGDYDQYPCSVVQTVNNISLTMKGNSEDAYTLLTWTDGEYSYSWSSGDTDTGMTQADAQSFVQSIVTNP